MKSFQATNPLLPRDPVGEAEALQWTITALNSVEMVSVPWWFLEITGAKENGLTGWLESRLAHMERVLSEREWLAADRFTVADLAMADVLRVRKVRSLGNRPATEAYVSRITDRPAFKKAYSDQMAHFSASEAEGARSPGATAQAGPTAFLELGPDPGRYRPVRSSRSTNHWVSFTQTSSFSPVSSQPWSRLGLSLTSMTKMPSSVSLMSTP